MLAKDPSQRYQTGRELLKDITRVREGLSGQSAAVTLPTQSVELMPLPSSAPAVVAPATATMVQPSSGRWRWRWLAVGMSLLGAATVGAGIGWFRHQRAFPLHEAVTPASEETPANRPETKEQALRTLLEPYLNARPNNPSERQKGLGHSLDLGLFYLEHNRLDDALALFLRLEKHPAVVYQLLGHLGQGIVLALQNQPHESNKHLRRAHLETRGKQPIKAIENLMWTDPHWRYWTSKAIHYNLKNGLNRSDIPISFRPFESR